MNPTTDNDDPRISEVRKVTLYYVDGTRDEFIIPTSQINKFVIASVKLYATSGLNPYCHIMTSKLCKIISTTLRLRGPFWWSTPDLEDDDNPDGAKVFVSDHPHILWDADNE